MPPRIVPGARPQQKDEIFIPPLRPFLARGAGVGVRLPFRAPAPQDVVLPPGAGRRASPRAERA